MALSTMAGKNFIGRLGAELDCAPVTDVLKVVDEETFVRPMYAGNALATVRTTDPLKIITVRPTSFEKAMATGGTASVESVPTPEKGADAGLATFVSESVSGGDRPDLTAARVVVSGGRGMKDGENFKILEKLADKLGGAVGASRAAVDAGFVANELQVCWMFKRNKRRRNLVGGAFFFVHLAILRVLQSILFASRILFANQVSMLPA